MTKLKYGYPFPKERQNLLKEFNDTPFVSFNNNCKVVLNELDDIVACYNISYKNPRAPKISLAIKKEYRKMGYGEEITYYLANALFDSDESIEYIQLEIDKENIKGLDTAKRCGFTIEYDLDRETLRFYILSKHRSSYDPEYQSYASKKR